MGEGAVQWCCTTTGHGSSGEWWLLYAAPGLSRDGDEYPQSVNRMPTPLELQLPDGEMKFGRA